MRIGPTFGRELREAGIPLDGIAWSADGTLIYADTIAETVRQQVAAVFAAHDPTKPAVVPDPGGFLRQVAAALGDPATATTLARQYPLFVEWVRALDGPAIQWCIVDAQSKGLLTEAQYDAIRAAVSTSHLPDVTLP